MPKKKAQIKSKTFYAVNIFKAKFVYTIVNFKIFYITWKFSGYCQFKFDIKHVESFQDIANSNTTT